MAKVLGFSIQINGTDQAVNTSEELRRAIAEIRNELKKAGDTDSIKKLEKQLVDLKARQNEVNKEIREEVKARQAELRAVDDVDGAYSKLSKQLIENRRRYKDLAAAGKENTEEGKALIKTVQALDKQLKDIDASVGQYQRNVGNYASAFDALIPNLAQFREGLKGIREQASGSGKALAVAALAFEAFRIIGGLLRDATEEAKVFRDVAGQIQQRYGLVGESLENATGTVLAISQVYQQETQEILNASNTLVKEFGISYQEAFTLIEAGLRRGANAQGDFLDQLREYPAVTRDAIGSAENLAAVLILAQEEGIYSDKGIDAIKEFDIRIKEQTKATKEALVNAFGEKATNEIFAGINNGSITTFDALKRVGKGLQDVNLTAQQTQTVIADVFGGPGEDAGIRYLQRLGDIDTELGNVTESTTEYQSQQFELFQATEELRQAEATFALALGDVGNEFEIATAKGKTFLLSVGKQLLKFFNELPATAAGFKAAFKQYTNNLINLRPFYEGVAEAYQDAFKPVFDNIKTQDEEAAKNADATAKARLNTEAGLQQKLAELRRNRAQEQIGSDAFKAIDKEIKAIELQLNKAKGLKAVGAKAGKQFIDGSIAAIEEETKRLEKAINESIAGSKTQAGLIAKLKEQEKVLAKAVNDRNRILFQEQRKGDDKIFTALIDSGRLTIDEIKRTSKAIVDEEKKRTDDVFKEVSKRQRLLNEETRKQYEDEAAQTKAGIEQVRDAAIQGAFDLVNAFQQRSFELRNRAFEEQISQTEANIQDLEKKTEGASRLRRRQLEKEIAAQQKLLEKQRADAEAERLRQAKAEKRLALIQSIIQGALAVQKALVQGGIFAAIATGIFAAVQTATIAAQPLATGGVVGLSGQRINAQQNIPTRSNGDNVLATVKRGEVVLNQRQQAALGGAQTFRSIGVPGFATGGAVSAPITAPVISTNRAASDFAATVAALDRKTDAINQRLDKLRAYVVSEDVARDLQEGENIKVNATL